MPLSDEREYILLDIITDWFYIYPPAPPISQEIKI